MAASLRPASAHSSAFDRCVRHANRRALTRIGCQRCTHGLCLKPVSSAIWLLQCTPHHVEVQMKLARQRVLQWQACGDVDCTITGACCIVSGLPCPAIARYPLQACWWRRSSRCLAADTGQIIADCRRALGLRVFQRGGLAACHSQPMLRDANLQWRRMQCSALCFMVQGKSMQVAN